MEKKNYSETVNYFKASDSGKYGKAFEINAKHYLNGNKGNSSKVSAKGKTDVKFKGVTFEIKSNCGEINPNIKKNGFVIYTMDNEHDYIEPWKAYVIPSNEFVQLIKKLGLMRTKKSSNGEWKTTIQSYKNSNKKASALARELMNYPTLEEYKSMIIG